MLICKVCSGDGFEKVDGFFTCRQCGTVSEDIRDELQDFMTFSQPSHHSAIIRLPRSSRDGESSDPENRVVVKSWNIYEAFTIILRRMTDDCIKCGASPEIEPVVFTLWAQYLQKLNVAFGGNSTVGLTSDESDLEGSQKDRDLIFCHRQSQLSLKRTKKRRRSVQSSGAESDTSVEGDSRRVKKKLIKSFVQREMSVDDLTADLYEFEDNDQSVRPPWKRARSRMSSFLNVSECNMSIITEESTPEPDLARHTSLVYEPEYLSLNKMLAFVYLALRLTRDKLAVYDIIRWASEGHVLYSEAWAHLSQEMSLSGADMVIFGKQCGFFAVLPSTNQLRDKAKRLACLLAVPTLPKQPVLPLVERLVTDLQLPSEVVSVVLKLMDQHYDLENLPPREDLASYSSGCAEVQAVSWVLVAMKVVLGMDGSTETLLSDLARQVNLALGVSAWPCAQPNVKSKKILFDFYAWMRFIELRTHKLIGQGVTMHSMPLSYTLHCSSFEGFCRKNITSRPVPVLSDKDKRKKGRPFKKFLTKFGCESASQVSDKAPTLFSQHGLIEKFIKEGTISGTGAAQLQQHFPATKLECFLEPMEMNQTLQPLGIQINWTAPLARDVCIHPFWHGAREKNVYVTAQKKLRHDKRVKRIDEKLHLKQPASDVHCTHVLNCQLPLSQYWVYRASTKRASQEDWEHFTQQLPASFVWLLNTCSALVWEHPRFVYEEMSRLEVLLFQVKPHSQL